MYIRMHLRRNAQYTHAHIHNTHTYITRTHTHISLFNRNISPYTGVVNFDINDLNGGKVGGKVDG